MLFQVEDLIGNLRSAATGLNVTVDVPGFSQPLPPSSFQRFLRARPIPGVVLEDHQSAYTNKWVGVVLKLQSDTLLTVCCDGQICYLEELTC